jgi:uncharacterized protein (DUF849 family)
MRLRHRHRARNIAIGSIIAAVSAGAATYAIYKFMEKRKSNQDTNAAEDKNEKIAESASDVLINKIGATNSEVEEAKLLSMTAYDLAKDKGFSEEQLKMFINQERVRPIDELILNRKISDDVGQQVKEKIIQHTDSWDGSL